MSSNINPYNIDGTYPIAGQDNDSQGFRDNFTNIRNNLVFAKDEIQDLQNKVILKSALSGTSLNNDMNGTILENPQLKAWTETSYTDLINVSGDITIDFTNGNFQKVTPNGPVTLTFANWPLFAGTNAAGYGSVRIWFEITNTDYQVTLPTAVSIGVDDIAGYDSETQTITFDTTGNFVFDISSVDSGTTYLIFDITRNRSTFRDPKLYYNTQTAKPTLYVGYPTAVALAVAEAIDQGLDTFNINGSMTSFGITTNANITTTTDVGGYSVGGMRGNVQTATLTPVVSSDLVGYYDAYAYTGTAGTGNTFVHSSAIAMYVTGSNVTYGLGSNVAIFTRADGAATTTGLAQALGIESNQSVKVYGNLITAGTKVDAGYQYYAPTTNFGGQQIWSNISRFIMDPTGTITNGNLRLPQVAVDGTVIKISSTQTITNLSVWNGTSSGVTPSANVTLTAGTGIEYLYHAGETKWYKVG